MQTCNFSHFEAEQEQRQQVPPDLVTESFVPSTMRDFALKESELDKRRADVHFWTLQEHRALPPSAYIL